LDAAGIGGPPHRNRDAEPALALGFAHVASAVLELASGPVCARGRALQPAIGIQRRVPGAVGYEHAGVPPSRARRELPRVRAGHRPGAGSRWGRVPPTRPPPAQSNPIERLADVTVGAVRGAVEVADAGGAARL